MPISGTWITYDPKSNFAFEKAVFVGKDKNGFSMFIGRGHHENDVLPGKFVLEQRSCFVPYGGREVKVDRCEILMNDNYGWIASSAGEIQAKAVIGGKSSSGEDLLIGRVSHEGFMTPGKIHPSHKTMYVPAEGGEHGYKNYEILVTGSAGFPMEITTKFQEVHITPNYDPPKPMAPESSFVPVPGVNLSSTASVTDTSSGIGWMISEDQTPQHPNIPAEKLIHCQLCSNQLVEAVYIPCGHCACFRCASALKKCHKCGQGIEKVQRIYFA